MPKSAREFFNPSVVTIFNFEDVPIGSEVWLMDEQWIKEFAPALEDHTPGVYDVGFHTSAIIHRVNEDSLSVSIYMTGNHYLEIRATLPRDDFVICVDRPEYDVKTRLFVTSRWLSDIHLRHHSTFAIFDAIGVKKALKSGTIRKVALEALRIRIDAIADETPKMALISFADSLLIKANYQVGQYDSSIRYSYNPDAMVRLFPVIEQAFQDTLGLGVYAVITQGINEYSDGSLLHLSRDHNHVSLNSLGQPFAQLLAIDRAVNEAIHHRTHAAADLYLDRRFYNSLPFDYAKFDKSTRQKYPYDSPMDDGDNYYYAENFSTITDALKNDRTE